MPKSIDDRIKEMHEKRMSKTEKDIKKATKRALKEIPYIPEYVGLNVKKNKPCQYYHETFLDKVKKYVNNKIRYRFAA